MAETSRLLRALQRIADTARKINPNPRPPAATQTTPNVLTSLPQHRPLLPLLLSHDIPPKVARACADRYDGYARRLKFAAESKLVPYLVNRNECQPAKVYSIFLGEYQQALRLWSQSILNTALKNLKRGSVELRNWDATYPAPLWLPLPPGPAFARKTTEKSCPLSSIPRPTHAFPTTYPPPLRPPSGVSPVEWIRAPATSLTPPTPAVDLDSLCSQFAASLIIDENARPTRQPRVSIFSLPVTASEGSGVDHCGTKYTKRKHSRAVVSNKLPATKQGVPPLRQLSLPPSFLSLSSTTKPTPHKAGAPRIPSSRHTPASLRPSASSRHTSATTTLPPLNTHVTGDQDTCSYSDPSTLLRSRPQSALDWTTHPPQPLSSAGPPTPPALPSHLFSEPIVVPSTPVPLSPGSSLMSIADPFLQFQPQYDYFSGLSLVSTFDYSGLVPVLATGSHFSKSTFDAPFGFDYLLHNTAVPMTSDPSENSFFSTCAST